MGKEFIKIFVVFFLLFTIWLGIKSNSSEEQKEEVSERNKIQNECNETYGLDEKVVDYVDEKMYLTIKEIYESIEFEASFNKGNPAKYHLFKEQYKKFLQGETTVEVKETGEEEYIYDLGEFHANIELDKFDITNYTYYFFDIDGDNNPELCVTDKARFTYVFKYEEERNQIVLWKEYISSTVFFMGTLKLGFAGGWSGDGFISLNEDGEYNYFVRFKVMGGAPYQNEVEEYGYLVSLPDDTELNNYMMGQSVYDEADERYYFRVTWEQYRELTKAYFEAVQYTFETIDDVTYTYAELFGNSEEITSQEKSEIENIISGDGREEAVR